MSLPLNVFICDFFKQSVANYRYEYFFNGHMWVDCNMAGKIRPSPSPVDDLLKLFDAANGQQQ